MKRTIVCAFAQRPIRQLSLFSILVTLMISPLLLPCVNFILKSDLYSYTLLILPLSAYLAYPILKSLPAPTSRPWVLIGLLTACAALISCLTLDRLHSDSPSFQNDVSATVTAFVFLLWAASAYCIGLHGIKSVSFPTALLVAMIPMPILMQQTIEHFLQHASAEVAYILFNITGMTLLRNDLVFHLPGISLQVAPECSGIHSSVVLFLTSLVAGHLFLKSPLRRLALAVAVIPLAIIRNGFRVWTLGELCVHVNRDLIDSWIHHRGGPIFFSLSLIPFSLLLWCLWRQENRSKAPVMPSPTSE